MWIASWLALWLLPLLQGAPQAELLNLESSLLNRQMDLGEVQAWNPERRVWMDQRPPPAPVLVLHLWAVDCPPCMTEFPRLRDIHRAYRRADPAVKFVFLAEPADQELLTRFLGEHREELPDGDLYRAKDAGLRRALGHDKVPTTLLLDQHGVVRRAFVGSLIRRRNELVTAIDRLLRVPR